MSPQFEHLIGRVPIEIKWKQNDKTDQGMKEKQERACVCARVCLYPYAYMFVFNL